MFNGIEAIRGLVENGLKLAGGTTQSANQTNNTNANANTNAEVETMNVTTSGVTTYNDVAGNQGDAANYVTEKGYMLGVNDETFNPDGKITRAYMAQVLYSMAGKPEVTGESQFSDVTNTAWYSKATIWAQQNGIISGYDDGTFKPTDEVTNEQALAMLRKYGAYKNLDTNAYIGQDEMASGFSDYNNVSDWAKDSMSWAADNWIVTGNSLNPQGTLSRIDLANYIKNFETTYANDLGLSNNSGLSISPIKPIEIPDSDNQKLGPTTPGGDIPPGYPDISKKDKTDYMLTPEQLGITPSSVNPSSTSNTTNTTTKYSDVKASDMEAVNYVSERGLMVGTSDSTFNPDAGITRGQIVQILYAMSGSPSNVGGKSSFSDVNSSDWYSNAVAWAQNTGLVAGYDDGTFRPNQVITEEQAAAILKRYAEQSGKSVTVSTPANYNSLRGTDQVSNYAQDAVKWAVSDGMMDTSNGSINPKSDVTRAEFAKYLMMYDKKYNNGTGKSNYNVTATYNPGLTNTSSTTQTSSGSTNLLDGNYWLDLLRKFPTSYNKESTKGIRNDPTFVKDPETGLYPNGTKSGVKWLDYDSSWSDKFNADMAGANSSISAGTASASAAANSFNKVANSGLSNMTVNMNYTAPKTPDAVSGAAKPDNNKTWLEEWHENSDRVRQTTIDEYAGAKENYEKEWDSIVNFFQNGIKK